jgi:glycerol uptake facilitator-like aquaporin
MPLRPIVAEFTGTFLLLLVVVGSGIMAERLCGGNVGLALLANAIATGGALVALILAFGPTSGAHFNPAVTLVDAWQGGVARALVAVHRRATPRRLRRDPPLRVCFSDHESNRDDRRRRASGGFA